MQKGRYAVTAILDVAIHGAQGPVALASIAQRQGISRSYLEQLFARLRQAGLVASARGPGGGYRSGPGDPGDFGRRSDRGGGRADGRGPVAVGARIVKATGRA